MTFDEEVDLDRAKQGEFKSQQLKLEELTARARMLLKTEEGRRELLGEIKEGLVTAMLIEREAGENERPGAYGPGNARQSRKQYKDLAELVLETLEEE